MGLRNSDVIGLLKAHRELITLQSVPMSFLVPLYKNLDILLPESLKINEAVSALSQEKRQDFMMEPNPLELYPIHPSMDFAVNTKHCENIGLVIKFLVQ